MCSKLAVYGMICSIFYLKEIETNPWMATLCKTIIEIRIRIRTRVRCLFLYFDCAATLMPPVVCPTWFTILPWQTIRGWNSSSGGHPSHISRSTTACDMWQKWVAPSFTVLMWLQSGAVRVPFLYGFCSEFLCEYGNNSRVDSRLVVSDRLHLFCCCYLFIVCSVKMKQKPTRNYFTIVVFLSSC